MSAPGRADRGARLGIVATGDELSRGDAIDTNSAAIAAALSGIGLAADRFVVLGDDEDALASTLLELSERCAFVVVTGGLGPTLDDVTRSAVARAAGVELERSEPVLEGIRAWFAGHGRTFAASNERQAWFPRGADVLPNPLGTAPGFACRVRGAHVFALPGPQREMKGMLEAEVVPRILRLAPVLRARPIARFYLLGLAESAFADLCGDWMARDAEPMLGVTAKGGVLSARLVASGLDGSEEALRLRALEFRERFASWIFSEEDAEPEFALARVLLERSLSVAIAESCTGGLVAQKLSRVPGISAVFDRGYVTYSNRSKTRLLGVRRFLIERKGAVSAEVAEAMARGAARRARTDLAVAVTGVAGPDGGAPEAPVGMVWFAVWRDRRTTSEVRHFGVRGRDLVREFTANTALDLLRRAALRD